MLARRLARTLCALTAGLLASACARLPPSSTVDRRRSEQTVVFEGMCDASAAVDLTEQHLVVASDEDNVLRTYEVDRGGPPVSAVDLSPALGLPLRGKKRRAPEADLEAATRLGPHAYWLTSHGRSAGGQRRPERLLFFSTTAATGNIQLLGQPYEQLLDDLVAEPTLAKLGLARAAELPPKAPGGLNIEGMAATPSGELLVAFRNPVPDGLALLVPLLNAEALVQPGGQTRAKLGIPILLDLGGDGVRALIWWRGGYLIVAGHYASEGPSRLYAWPGHGPATLLPIDLSALNPEGIFVHERRPDVLLLSDDGTRHLDGVPCKDLSDPAMKRFRGLWVRPH